MVVLVVQGYTSGDSKNIKLKPKKCSINTYTTGGPVCQSVLTFIYPCESISKFSGLRSRYMRSKKWRYSNAKTI